MEMDLSKFDKKDQITKWNSLEEVGGGTGHGGQTNAKCYICNFCKRGFSNAQALGGHMNIHRRDRAKLIKQSSDEENLLSLDITPAAAESSPDYDPLPALDERNLLPLEKNKTCFSSEQQLIQLPLFAAGVRSEERKNMDQASHDDYVENNKLDLELRLGLEHQETTQSSLTTRDFF